MWHEMKAVLGEGYENFSPINIMAAHEVEYRSDTPFGYISRFADIVVFPGKKKSEWEMAMDQFKRSIKRGKERINDPLPEEFWRLLEHEVSTYEKNFVWTEQLSGKMSEIFDERALGTHVNRVERLETVLFDMIPAVAINTKPLDFTPIANILETLTTLYTILFIYTEEEAKAEIGRWIVDIQSIRAEIESIKKLTTLKSNGREELAIWMTAVNVLNIFREVNFEVGEDLDYDINLSLSNVATAYDDIDDDDEWGMEKFWYPMTIASVYAERIVDVPTSKYTEPTKNPYWMMVALRPPRTVFDLVYHYKEGFCTDVHSIVKRASASNDEIEQLGRDLVDGVKGEKQDEENE